MIIVLRIPPAKPINDGGGDEEEYPRPNHASPVGYVVPELPNFVIDPNQIKKGSPCLSLTVEILIGCAMALVLGGFMVFLSVSEIDEKITESLNNAGF